MPAMPADGPRHVPRSPLFFASATRYVPASRVLADPPCTFQPSSAEMRAAASLTTSTISFMRSNDMYGTVLDTLMAATMREQFADLHSAPVRQR